MNTHARRLLPLAALLLTVGCSADSPVDPAGVEPRKTLNTECLNTASFTRRSGSTIYYSVNGSPSSTVDNAAGRWNSGVASGARPGRYPRFAPGSGDVSVVMHPYAPTTSVTGVWEKLGTKRIDICDGSNLSTCDDGNPLTIPQWGTIANVTMHEFAHTYGFGHAKPGSAVSCVSNPESVTGTYDLHPEEKERIWLYYDGLAVTSVALSAPDVTLDVGQTVTAQGTANLSDGGQSRHASEFTWSSNNTYVATVSSSGVVTAVGSGTATITATAVGTGLSSPLTFTVSQPRSVSLSGPSYVSAKGTYTYTATISGFSTPSYTWEQRYCNGFTEASCGSWVLVSTSASPLGRVLEPDCSTADRNFQVRVTVRDQPYGYAAATRRTALCTLP